jgi:4-hydroxybenzoate polyprenyltransferase
MILSFLGNLLRISRPLNLIILAFAQLMVAYFLIETTSLGKPVLLDINLYALILATTMIAAAGYMINDYYDVKIDYINKPREVIVGKGMKRRWVIFLHTAINFMGIGIGYWVDPLVGSIVFISAFLLWFYSNLLKRLPFIGNFVVAILTGTSIGIVGWYYKDTGLVIFAYAVFAFFINLIREIIKDIEDRQGDRKHGCKTLPIVFGFRKTKKIIFLISLVFVFSLVLVTLQINSLKLFIYFGSIGILFLWFMLKIYQADRKKHFEELSVISKIIMILGILSMAFL